MRRYVAKSKPGTTKLSRFSQPTSATSHPKLVPTLTTQILWLLVLATPVASVTWTVTHEEAFREPREYCKRQSESAAASWRRKFFYLFTCEYCFSHYIAAALLAMTRFKLLYPNWRGYMVSLFALVWMANVYMGAFANLRLDIRHERIEIQSKDLKLRSQREEMHSNRAA